ncbi:MAG: hypothetical protein K2O54_03775 [Prevotella sp.]|nr:hypothetical protein [Prevotella sp.]
MFRKKKGTEVKLPSGAEQANMRQDIINRLEKVILNWNPKFASSCDEAKVLSDSLLSDLRAACDTLSRLFLPRTSMIVVDYYEILTNQLDCLEDNNIMSEFKGENDITNAVEKISEIARAWEELK